MNAAWNLLASQIVTAYRAAGERRRVCRYIVKIPRARVGWWEGQSFVSLTCELVDLSMNGCQIGTVGRRAPGADQPIWLRPAGMAEDEWIEGRVVAARRAFLGGLKIRIRFETALSYEIFNQLVYGREHILDTPLRDLPEHERDQIWR